MKKVILFLSLTICYFFSFSQAQVSFKDARDGEVYKTVTIGTQTWFAENLRTTLYTDSSEIKNITENSEWKSTTIGAFCWYNNDIANKNQYGALYNGYSVNTGNLCPSGWHVPTDDDWKILEKQLGMNQNEIDNIKLRGTIQGNVLKVGGSSGFDQGNRI